MTNQQHPITPPPELVQQWVDDLAPLGMQALATQATRWGADQELEACCAYLVKAGLTGDACGLQLTRRPKPPSLKEQALAIVCRGNQALTTEEQITIRRALEQLDD